MEYTSEHIELMKKEIYNLVSTAYSFEDVNSVDDKYIILMFEDDKRHNRQNSGEFASFFTFVTGKMPTKPGKYFITSRPDYKSYLSWGMIDMSFHTPNMVWMPEEHIIYHRERLLSGLISTTEVNI